MRPHTRRLLFKLIPYPVISLISGLIYFIVERGILGDSLIYPATGNLYSATSSFFATSSMATVLGLFIGLIEESSLFSTKLKHLSFVRKIVLKTTIYVFLVLFLLLIVTFIINSINMNVHVFDSRVLETIQSFFLSFTLLSIVIFIGFMIGVTLFFSEIVDYLGFDVVRSFFTGRYAKSVIEDRIFMFLDMKDSTSIAERLGHENHYKLINDYYSDMSDSIIKTNGHIYQYVGDEVVVFWDRREGLSKNLCLTCFYLIKESIRRKSIYYKEKYGQVPEFKAALHVGKVTRGQVGLIKRELLFTGDVLNTTARIQALCNELNAELLISNELKELLSVGQYEFKNKGSFTLKGKHQEEILHEVQLKDTSTNT